VVDKMIINPKDFKIEKVTLIVAYPNYGDDSKFNYISAIDYINFNSESTLLEHDSIELKLYDTRCYADMTEDKFNSKVEKLADRVNKAIAEVEKDK